MKIVATTSLPAGPPPERQQTGTPHQLSGPILIFIPSNSDFIYDMPKHIVASHSMSGRLAGGYLGSYLDCMN